MVLTTLEIKGYILNPNTRVVEGVVKRIESVTQGNCPCVPSNTWSNDTLCPCLYYREGNGCHCGLYIKA